MLRCIGLVSMGLVGVSVVWIFITAFIVGALLTIIYVGLCYHFDSTIVKSSQPLMLDDIDDSSDKDDTSI